MRHSPWIAHRLFLLCLFLALTTITSQSQAEARPDHRQLPVTRTTGSVLLVDGGDFEIADAFYHEVMDSIFGEGNWDRYDLAEQGMPDPPELLLGVLRQYQAVIWHTRNIELLDAASEVLGEYLQPSYPGSPPGRLLLVAPTLYQGLAGLDPHFRTDGLGIHHLQAPVNSIHIPAAQAALSFGDDLPDLIADLDVPHATGVEPLEGTEVLYQMEYCPRCYSVRPPWDPMVGVRRPAIQESTFARAITLTVPLEYFDNGLTAMQTLVQYHLGVVPNASATSA